MENEIQEANQENGGCEDETGCKPNPCSEEEEENKKIKIKGVWFIDEQQNVSITSSSR